MPQSPTKQELAERALELFQIAKRVLPHADWSWRDQTLYQEWCATAQEVTLLDAFNVHSALVAELPQLGWTYSCDSNETIYWRLNPLPETDHMKHAYELRFSMDLGSDALDLSIVSDIGKMSHYDEVDPNDDGEWVRPGWWLSRQAASAPA